MISAATPTWAYTAFGGGPVLLQDGQINEIEDNCVSNPRYQLNEIDPVANCAGAPKPPPAPPVLEIYGSSCYATAHTAGGLSADKRWLFMVINDGKLLPEQLAVFMHINLGVQEALKFDGGGSSALWFKGATELTVNPVSDDRPLSNWMAIHAQAGTGISLPLEATTRSASSPRFTPTVSLPHSSSSSRTPARTLGCRTITSASLVQVLLPSWAIPQRATWHSSSQNPCRRAKRSNTPGKRMQRVGLLALSDGSGRRALR